MVVRSIVSDPYQPLWWSRLVMLSLPVPGSNTPVVATSSISAAVQLSHPLFPDVTFQNFREWRWRWKDYVTMVDLASLPNRKQLIQLRMYLSLEFQSVGAPRLQVFHRRRTVGSCLARDQVAQFVISASKFNLKNNYFRTRIWWFKMDENWLARVNFEQRACDIGCAVWRRLVQGHSFKLYYSPTNLSRLFWWTESSIPMGPTLPSLH